MSVKVDDVYLDITEAQFEDADSRRGFASSVFRVRLTKDQLQSVLDQMLMDSRYNKDFDLKLASGLWAEMELKGLLEASIEVKHDPTGQRTGNMALEFEYKGEPSGIAATKADVWAHQVYRGGPFVVWRSEQLRALLDQFRKAYPKRVKRGGDGNHAKMATMAWQWVVTGGQDR